MLHFPYDPVSLTWYRRNTCTLQSTLGEIVADTFHPLRRGAQKFHKLQEQSVISVDAFLQTKAVVGKNVRIPVVNCSTSDRLFH
jgi:hypothetical protein